MAPGHASSVTLDQSQCGRDKTSERPKAMLGIIFMMDAGVDSDEDEFWKLTTR
jgi:hypothetical protein